MRYYKNKQPMIYEIMDDCVKCINPNFDPKVEFYIDLEDLDRVKNNYWCFGVRKYIISSKGRLHRYLMNCPKNMICDHRNGNIHNNRKSNLCICTQHQNCMNQSNRSDNKSGYKGVSKEKHKTLWRADIRLNGKNIYIGQYNTKEEAALAYNENAIELFGEYAKLNIVNR